MAFLGVLGVRSCVRVLRSLCVPVPLLRSLCGLSGSVRECNRREVKKK